MNGFMKIENYDLYTTSEAAPRPGAWPSFLKKPDLKTRCCEPRTHDSAHKRNNRFSPWVLGLLAGLASGLWIEAATAPRINTDNSTPKREAAAVTSYSGIIKKAAPSVVNIYSTKIVKMPRNHPFLNDPFWGQFFGPGDEGEGTRDSRTRREQNLGSGVVISEDGYILTNFHVVEGADEIKVAFAKSKEEYTAKVIGSDPPTDLAVLKIEAKGLPAVTFTDSDQLDVGDVVLAIGNPFGVGQTVTLGIVSAVGRGGFGIVDYEDFIQTDASINPGNSGGALIDAHGRLVGINTAIISRTGGNQGIGFAVPANMVRGVMDRILSDGKVTRGYLGVFVQPVTPELAKQFELPDTSGALVGGVSPGTPAEKAGLKEGDVIVEFNGKKMADNRQLRLTASQTPPGTKVPVKVYRDGDLKTINVTLGELPTDALTRAGGEDSGPAQSDVLDGVEVTDLDTRTRRQLGIPAHVSGALVTQVDPESPSYEAGLRPGGVILSINRQTVNNAEDAVALSKKIKGDRILLRVWYQGGSQYLVIDAGKKAK